MDTPWWAKILLILIVVSVVYSFTLDLEFLGKIVIIFQTLFMSLMILALRTSLLSFYKMSNITTNEFHPKYLNPQYKIKKLSMLNLKILVYSNCGFFEKSYINFYENNPEVGRLLNGIQMPPQEIRDLDRKPYYLLATYSMRQCIDCALWAFLFTVMNIVIEFIKFF